MNLGGNRIEIKAVYFLIFPIIGEAKSYNEGEPINQKYKALLLSIFPIDCEHEENGLAKTYP